ncbi:MAG: crosslink repair DNA glycosylase YcaQ family protein [Candidatus Bipolaricaulota bacterium]
MAMAARLLPPPQQTLEPAHARRFLLSHQRLLPPRSVLARGAIARLLRHLGCIQYDPIDIVGRNPNLVLQSRIVGYRPEMLDRFMHLDHKALVVWDKMAAIALREDWPHFARHRVLMAQQHGGAEKLEMQIAPYVLDEIRRRGPLSSRDIEHDASVDWWWGRKKRLVGASLEVLSAMGVVLTHHRVRSERYFDLAERILPPEILGAPDPHPRDEDYQDWHVVRRIGSLGLAPATGAPEYWWGIMGVKGTAARSAVLRRLADRGDLVPLAVDGVARRLFFVRASDGPALEAAGERRIEPVHAAFVAALDNVAWDRDLLRQVFGFDYCWEIYKPKEKREYGYYVLPVLCGDRFVARVEPVFDKKAKVLRIEGWWWEPGFRPDEATKDALATCTAEFARYLGAERVELGERPAAIRGLQAALRLGRRPKLTRRD